MRFLIFFSLGLFFNAFSLVAEEKACYVKGFNYSSEGVSVFLKCTSIVYDCNCHS